VKSKILQWAEHVVRTGKLKNAYNIFVVNCLEGIKRDGKITLRWILGRMGGGWK
jgi:hypothetical protein